MSNYALGDGVGAVSLAPKNKGLPIQRVTNAIPLQEVAAFLGEEFCLPSRFNALCGDL
jgi:hypothetical protein